MNKDWFLLVGGGGRESAFALRLMRDASVSAFVARLIGRRVRWVRACGQSVFCVDYRVR